MVLKRTPGAAKLREPSVVAMRADWTRPDSAITTYPHSFGCYGVPFDLVYEPGAPPASPCPEPFTSGAVMDAFRHAASSPAGHQECGMTLYRLRFRKDHRRMAGTKSAEQLSLGEMIKENYSRDIYKSTVGRPFPSHQRK